MLEKVAPEPTKCRYFAQTTGLKLTIKPSIDHIPIGIETVELAHDEKTVVKEAGPAGEACTAPPGNYPSMISIYPSCVESIFASGDPSFLFTHAMISP